MRHESPSSTARPDESGIALLITVVVLLMVSAIGISALNRAGDENAISGSSRRKLTTLQAAETGMRMVEEQFAAASAGPPVVPQAIDQRDLVTDPSGLKTAVRTGTIDNALPMQIVRVGSADNCVLDESTGQCKGDEMKQGNTGVGKRAVYRVEVVATDAGAGNVQLQTQFSVSLSGGSY